jgi:hypothetical protein
MEQEQQTMMLNEINILKKLVTRYPGPPQHTQAHRNLRRQKPILPCNRALHWWRAF